MVSYLKLSAPGYHHAPLPSTLSVHTLRHYATGLQTNLADKYLVDYVDEYLAIADSVDASR